MAVQSDTSRISYAGNNSTTTSYAVPFVFLENAHLKAIAKTSAGVETVVTLTNHTGAGDVNGGTVRTAVAVPATSTLTIYRDVPITQTTTYAEGGDFPAASHERALDKLTQISQQNARQIGSTVRFSEATQLNPINPPVSATPHVLTTVNGGAPTWETVPSVSFPASLNALSNATTVNATDELVIQQDGVTKRATATELFASEPFNATGINSGGISLFAQQDDAASRKILCANPVNGGRIVINGVMRQFQSGLTLDTTAYSASTRYFVYAYWTGSAIALELSTTDYDILYVSSHSAIAIKTGDSSRTLVGQVYLDANKELVNNVQQNSIANWYNQQLNFLAGQNGASELPPEQWTQFEAEVTARYDPLDPFNPANWQEIGTVSNNVIDHLTWRAQLGRFPAVVMGISGNGTIFGVNQRLRIGFGITSRGATQPISSVMTSVASTNFDQVNVSGASTYGYTNSGREQMTIWGQIIGFARPATGTHSNDTITCSGNTFQNDLPVRFLSLTGGAGLSANTKYFVREHSGSVGSTFKLSTTALFVSVTGNASTDVITVAGHTFTNNQLVRFTSLTGGSGLSTGTDYYVRDVSGITFKLAATSGGAAINFTTGITEGSIGAPIINFTTDISAATIDANGATVRVNSFASYWG
jgi:hypothetical protein